MTLEKGKWYEYVVIDDRLYEVLVIDNSKDNTQSLILGTLNHMGTYGISKNSVVDKDKLSEVIDKMIDLLRGD
jgi:hypothetical protein